jgi:hypothetical protein
VRTIPLNLLDNLSVAKPCPASWDSMRPVGGDGDRVRHCAGCGLDVFNISAMPRGEAEALIRSRLGERLCVRMFQRTDGTLISQDCPVGLRLWRQRLSRGLARLAAAVVVMASGIVLARSHDRTVAMPGLSRAEPFATLCRWVRPPQTLAPAPPAPGVIMRMGDVRIGP